MKKLLCFRILFVLCSLCAASQAWAGDDDEEKSFQEITEESEERLLRSGSGQHLAEFMTDVGQHLPKLSTVVLMPQRIVDYFYPDYPWLLTAGASLSIFRMLLANELRDNSGSE